MVDSCFIDNPLERHMITFEVNDMTCGHCVGAITEAVASVDPGATVHVDLASHRVEIEPAASSADVLSGAIEGAGYAPVALASTAAQAGKTAARSRCCCG
jgi:copper chaperone